MATEPLDPSAEAAALRLERTELAARLVEAEEIAEQLADELAAARIENAELRAGLQARPRAAAAPMLAGATPLEVDEPDRKPADPAVLPMVLWGLAALAGVVMLVSFANNGLFSFTTIVLLLLTGGLAWGAVGTRVEAVEVSVDNGVVTVARGETRHRLDLARESTKVEVRGRPGDPSWRVRFARGVLDPVDVDASMVDAEEFLAQLRRYRPDL